MPADTNGNGDIFGGWVMAQVDLAGSVLPARLIQGRMATVAVNEFIFKQPVRVGDLLSFFSSVTRLGNTSITVQVEVYAEHIRAQGQHVKVTEARLTYVAIDDQGRPRPGMSARSRALYAIMMLVSGAFLRAAGTLRACACHSGSHSGKGAAFQRCGGGGKAASRAAGVPPELRRRAAGGGGFSEVVLKLVCAALHKAWGIGQLFDRFGAHHDAIVAAKGQAQALEIARLRVKPGLAHVGLVALQGHGAGGPIAGQFGQLGHQPGVGFAHGGGAGHQHRRHLFGTERQGDAFPARGDAHLLRQGKLGGVAALVSIKPPRRGGSCPLTLPVPKGHQGASGHAHFGLSVGGRTRHGARQWPLLAAVAGGQGQRHTRHLR